MTRYGTVIKLNSPPHVMLITLFEQNFHEIVEYQKITNPIQFNQSYSFKTNILYNKTTVSR